LVAKEKIALRPDIGHQAEIAKLFLFNGKHSIIVGFITIPSFSLTTILHGSAY